VRRIDLVESGGAGRRFRITFLMRLSELQDSLRFRLVSGRAEIRSRRRP